MKYDYINFVTWNLDYWKRTCTDISNSLYKSPETINLWKKLVRYNLDQLNADIILLQEINPFFIFETSYKQADLHCYEFEINRKKIYYHEFSKELEREGVEKANFWGSSIITDEKYKLLEKNIFDKASGFMCYDFRLNSEKTVTVINYYNKAKYGQYYCDKDFITALEQIIKTKSENLIILAGDFNSNINSYNKRTFTDISNMGFITKTKNIGTTMVNYEYQNDHIFVNDNMNKCIQDIHKFSQWNITDHFGLSCTIKL
jgi:endonuclease/exonuclease/phosphatase family metal-dependent hydrolase